MGYQTWDLYADHMQMCIHTYPNHTWREIRVTLSYIPPVCILTSQPLSCSGTNRKNTHRLTQFHVLFLPALQSERYGAIASGQWTPPTLPLLSHFPSAHRDIDIKITSQSLPTAPGKLFGHYEMDTGVYFDSFSTKTKAPVMDPYFQIHCKCLLLNTMNVIDTNISPFCRITCYFMKVKNGCGCVYGSLFDSHHCTALPLACICSLTSYVIVWL